MKLPHRHFAYIPASKLPGYLLSENHAVGKSKANFFYSFGYDAFHADVLAQGLLAIAREHPVTEVVTSPHGTKYIIDGPLSTPSGRTVYIRTVWIVEKDETTPRFVTAYPL